MLDIFNLDFEIFRQQMRHCKQNKSSAVLVKKTWRDAAGRADAKIFKWQSTFSFTIIKLLKVSEK